MDEDDEEQEEDEEEEEEELNLLDNLLCHIDLHQSENK